MKSRSTFRTSCQEKLRASLADFPVYKDQPIASVKQLSEITGLTKTSVYTAIKRGTLKELDLPLHGGTVLLVEEFISYLDNPLGRPKKEILESEVV